MAEDWKNLRGEEMRNYLFFSHDTDDDKEAVKLLMFSYLSEEEKNAVLERISREGKHLVAVYPCEGETPPEGAVEVCGIWDGALYLY